MSIIVQYAGTFERSLHRVVRHALCYQDKMVPEVLSFLDKLITDFEARVTEHPESCPRCEQAFRLGVTGYREYNHTGYRVIYRIDGETVWALLLLHQKQDIEATLIDFCLLN